MTATLVSLTVEGLLQQAVAASPLLDGLTATHKRTLSVNGSLKYLTVELQLSSPLMTQHLASMDEIHVLMTTFSFLMELVAMLLLF